MTNSEVSQNRAYIYGNLSDCRLQASTPERVCEPRSLELAQRNDGKFNFRRAVCKVIQYITVCALLLYYIE